MHFGCYSLHKVQQDPALLYSLGDRVLPEIAESFGYELPDVPTADTLSEMISIAAPHKTLRDNVAYTKQLLGEHALGCCVAWLDRSGVMSPVRGGAFVDPTVAAPQQFETVVWSGGTANWMLRRLALTQQLDPNAIARILLPMGNRTMATGEHQLVRTYANEYGQLPTEAEFALRFIEPALVNAGFGSILPIPVESGHANQILAQLFDEYPDLLDPEHQTLVIGNAPNAVQAAGQFRLAGRAIDTSYDYRGSQLFFRSDGFPVALHDEPASEAQNPISGLGQLLRNFKVLLDNVEAPKAA